MLYAVYEIYKCYTKLTIGCKVRQMLKLSGPQELATGPPSLGGCVSRAIISRLSSSTLLALHCFCSNQHSVWFWAKEAIFDHSTTDTILHAPWSIPVGALLHHRWQIDPLWIGTGKVQHGDKCQSVSCCVTSRDIGNLAQHHQTHLMTITWPERKWDQLDDLLNEPDYSKWPTLDDVPGLEVSSPDVDHPAQALKWPV